MTEASCHSSELDGAGVIVTGGASGIGADMVRARTANSCMVEAESI